MSEIGDYLREKRGKRSLREIEKLSGVSHTYLSSLEKGTDPRSGNEIIPSPEVLAKLSEALGVPYLILMDKAGHLPPGLLSVHADFDESIPVDERKKIYSYLNEQYEKDLYYLTNIDDEVEHYTGPLYYKGNKLTDEQRDKIHIMLKALLE